MDESTESRRCRRRSADATVLSLTPQAFSVGGYRLNRSSGGRLVGTALAVRRAVHAARVTISTNSSKDHHQRRRPPRWGLVNLPIHDDPQIFDLLDVATHSQCKYRHTF